jgi:diaminopimelate decarboxylase
LLKILSLEVQARNCGELYLALKFGYLRNKIIYTGVGKTDEEIEYALGKNVFNFTVESLQEIQ